MTFVSIAVEGACDGLAAQKLVESCGLSVRVVHDCRGKPSLDKRLEGFLRAANHSGWFILRDLDNDAACAPTFLRDKSLTIPKLASFRVAVRSLEAWLLADANNVAEWLNVKTSAIPTEPEEMPWPKRDLANIAAKSRTKLVRERMAPRPENGSIVGPEYGAAVFEFIRDRWDFEQAIRSGRAPSLEKAVSSLKRLERDLRVN